MAELRQMWAMRGGRLANKIAGCMALERMVTKMVMPERALEMMGGTLVNTMKGRNGSSSLEHRSRKPNTLPTLNEESLTGFPSLRSEWG